MEELILNVQNKHVKQKIDVIFFFAENMHINSQTFDSRKMKCSTLWYNDMLKIVLKKLINNFK